MTKDEFMEKFQTRHLTVEWTTGGMTGGNCWGDSPSSSVESDPEPEFDILIEILLEISPTVMLSEYQVIIKDSDLITLKTWEDWEYYGNHYSKASKTLDLDVLWNYVQIILDIPDPNVRLSHYKLMEE